MRKFRVSVYRLQETNGYVEIDADDDVDAMNRAADLADWEIEVMTDWDSCGDTTEYGIDLLSHVEEIIEPTVSEGLWK